MASAPLKFLGNLFELVSFADLSEDLAAEQKARATYDNILRLADDPDVIEPIKFLRAREVVHFQRFGEALDKMQEKLKCKQVKGTGIKKW